MRFTMTPWRAVLLVLLIVLLPLRGALAGTLCAPGHHEAAPAAVQAHEHAQYHHHHDGDSAQPVADASHGPGSCHVCASFCTATPLLAAMPVIQAPTEAQRLSFPVWAAPAPLFLSDGQERPPRRT